MLSSTLFAVAAATPASASACITRRCRSGARSLGRIAISFHPGRAQRDPGLESIEHARGCRPAVRRSGDTNVQWKRRRETLFSTVAEPAQRLEISTNVHTIIPVPHLGFPHGDARLDLTDLYAFGKPGDDRSRS